MRFSRTIRLTSAPKIDAVVEVDLDTSEDLLGVAEEEEEEEDVFDDFCAGGGEITSICSLLFLLFGIVAYYVQSQLSSCSVTAC
jgi:hypothetical protein